MLKIRTNKENKSRNRSRNIIWFNPPFSQNVRTNIAKSSHKLHKIFNRNNLTVICSCITNMAIIKSHSQRIFNDNDEPSNEETCNCTDKQNLCPLGGAVSPTTLSTKLLSPHLRWYDRHWYDRTRSQNKIKQPQALFQRLKTLT